LSISLPQIESSRGRGLGGEKSAFAARGGISWTGAAYLFFFCGARLAFAAFLLLTTVYCVLVWVPFSYFGFIRNPLVNWIPEFVRLHGLIYGVLLGAVAVTLIPDLRGGEQRGADLSKKETRRAAAAFLILNAIAVVYLLLGGGLAGMQPDLTSYFWSMLGLLPLIWLAALDFAGRGNQVSGTERSGIGLAETTLAAVIVSVTFAIASVLHTVQGGDFSGSAALREFGASLCFHLVIFAAVGVILLCIRWITDRTPWPAARFTLTRVLAWVLLVLIIRKLILPTISFAGRQADIFAAVVSLAVVMFASGFVVRLRALNGYTALSSLWARVPEWFWGFACLGVFALAYNIPVVIGRTDWDFVLQRVAVIAVWLLVLQMVGWSEVRLRGKAMPIVLALVLGSAAVGFVRYAKLTLYNPDPAPQWQGVLDTFAATDISFKTAYVVLSRPVDNKSYRQFYEFLKQNTNLGRDAVAHPADVRLVSDLQPAPGIKPNIFLFVIDSLRQDFVSPYNPQVDYTPQIGAFAKDSVVLENAYTRYGGTALSEPAIWVGAMQLHKQYIDPFYPMNNLQKLLETDGYQSYISVDPILRMILRPSPSITELDKGSSWSDLDFIPTLKELETKIDARTDSKKPIFAYTQPQNVHTVTLERSKIKGGRREVSMYELRRMDAAFGQFLDFLRQRGLYDNSIVIVTADHGDAYGEFGRWGHSDFLVPQVIHIPMIVHLPPRMDEQFVSDPHALAFTTDITPSLYYLLGHRPIVNNELFGRPLFTQTLEEQASYKRPQYLIASSYAPVYAVLGGNGQSLFIVDAVNSRNYDYNLLEDPAGTHSHVTIQLEKENEAVIRREVGLIDDLYGWHSPAN
jgi:Sulfatase